MEIADQTKLGDVIKTNGAFINQFEIVGCGMGVVPGALFLSTYNGGSPKIFPFTKPKKLQKVFKKLIILSNSKYFII